MRYELEIRKRAEKDLASLSKPDAQKIADAIFALENGLTGKIKKLTNHTPEYRLRVGVWRVLFEVSTNKIIIYRILHRKEAYR
ncbi:MAG: type II toxin-antitoxin system RelE/ParE family toxin [Thermodesulfovibrionales bacterium]